MGAVLAIIAYELHTTTVQTLQGGINSSPECESNTPEMGIDLILWTCPAETLFEVEPETETNGLESCSIKLTNKVQNILEEESELEAMTETQIPEDPLNEKYYLNCLHSSPYQKLFLPPRVKPYFKPIPRHELYKKECRESACIPCECVDYHASFLACRYCSQYDCLCFCGNCNESHTESDCDYWTDYERKKATTGRRTGTSGYYQFLLKE